MNRMEKARRLLRRFSRTHKTHDEVKNILLTGSFERIIDYVFDVSNTVASVRELLEGGEEE